VRGPIALDRRIHIGKYTSYGRLPLRSFCDHWPDTCVVRRDSASVGRFVGHEPALGSVGGRNLMIREDPALASPRGMWPPRNHPRRGSQSQGQRRPRAGSRVSCLATTVSPGGSATPVQDWSWIIALTAIAPGSRGCAATSPFATRANGQRSTDLAMSEQHVKRPAFWLNRSDLVPVSFAPVRIWAWRRRPEPRLRCPA
jgi:hypothetical protein